MSTNDASVSSAGSAWLPGDFCHPARVDLECGVHLRPIRGSDAEIDYPAVMGSRERLWRKYGQPWGWPPAMLTLEEDREDLERHEREIRDHESFNYAMFDPEESKLLGCVYLDPPGDDPEHDVIVSWWVVDDRVGTSLEAELDEFVPRWVTSGWPFRRPRYAP